MTYRFHQCILHLCTIWSKKLYITIRFIDFLFGKMRIYSRMDFSCIFSLIFDDFSMDLLKNTGWNLLISNGNGISTSFLGKKLYFHCFVKKIMTSANNNFFPWVMEISFLHTKGCGNAPLFWWFFLTFLIIRILCYV